MVKIEMKAVREKLHLKIGSEYNILRVLTCHKNLCSVPKVQNSSNMRCEIKFTHKPSMMGFLVQKKKAKLSGSMYQGV